MSTLDDWLASSATALNLPAGLISPELRTGLLDVTRDVAHGVTRIAGPLTTYLIGVAVGAGADPAEAVRTLAALAADVAPTPDADAASDTAGGEG